MWKNQFDTCINQEKIKTAVTPFNEARRKYK